MNRQPRLSKRFTAWPARGGNNSHCRAAVSGEGSDSIRLCRQILSRELQTRRNGRPLPLDSHHCGLHPGRQEYLGHTVLGKSICENFKTKQRRAATADELMIFPNTHEAIVDQDTWDIAHKLRLRKRPQSSQRNLHPPPVWLDLLCRLRGKNGFLRLRKRKHYDSSTLPVRELPQYHQPMYFPLCPSFGSGNGDPESNSGCQPVCPGK